MIMANCGKTIALSCTLAVLIALERQPRIEAQTASVSAASHIVPPSPSFHVPENQKFVYSVKWHLLDAGSATVLIQPSNSSKHLRATADTSGVVNRIFPVHDTLDADIDTRTFCTVKVSKHTEEGSRRLNRTIH